MGSELSAQYANADSAFWSQIVQTGFSMQLLETEDLIWMDWVTLCEREFEGDPSLIELFRVYSNDKINIAWNDAICEGGGDSESYLQDCVQNMPCTESFSRIHSCAFTLGANSPADWDYYHRAKKLSSPKTCGDELEAVYTAGNSLYFPAFFLEGPVGAMECCGEPMNTTEFLNTYEQFCNGAFDDDAMSRNSCLTTGQLFTEGRLSQLTELESYHP